MKKLVLSLVATTVMFQVGCSSTPTREELAEESLRIQEQREEAAQARIEKKNEELEEKMELVPDWYLEPPTGDEVGVFGVGLGTSPRIDNALKIAQLQSEFDVAKQMRQELSGQERLYNKQTGDDEITSQYSELVDKLVTRVPVVGFDVLKKEVKVVDGKYTAYILIKLPFREFNRVLQQEKAANQDATINSAFDALEKRVRERELERQNASATVVAPAYPGERTQEQPVDKN